MLCAAIRLVAPAEGEIVSQLQPSARTFLRMPRELRADPNAAGKGAVREDLRKRGFLPLPIRFGWVGPSKEYDVTVARMPDGKVFHSGRVKGTEFSLAGRLEVARKWKWTVSDGVSEVSGEFRTAEEAPRIVNWPNIKNVRDIGGRIGKDGRRVKQGLVFRSAGLNNNAPTTYYTYEEIMELHRRGQLATAGIGKSFGLGAEYEARIRSGKGLDRNHLRLIKGAPTAPGSPRLDEEGMRFILDNYGIRTDIDFRNDFECFGMVGSPLGSRVDWKHFPMYSGYGGFTDPYGRAAMAYAFGVLVNRNNYPLVFHCIGGTDRTGTFGFVLNAFLGVEEEELVKDYEMSFIRGAGVDPLHYGWLKAMIASAQALPGEDYPEKFKRFFVSLGFTEEQVEGVREFLLEPAELGREDCIKPPNGDATSFLQSHLDDASCGKLILDGGDWHVSSLFVRRNGLEVVLGNGARLIAKEGAFRGARDCLLTVDDDVEGFVLRGEKDAELRMRLRDYQDESKYAWSEWRHAVSVRSARNVRIANVVIDGAGGDGVYVNGGEDVQIEDVAVRNCNRLGFAVISGCRVAFRRCLGEMIRGTSPKSGIDLEPNKESNRLSDIVIEDCEFRDNDGCGVMLHLSQLTEKSQPVSVVIRNCRSHGNKGNGFQLTATGEKGVVRGTVLLEGCAAKDNGQKDNVHFSACEDGVKEVVRRCDFAKTFVAPYVKPVDAAPLSFEDLRPINGCRTAVESSTGYIRRGFVAALPIADAGRYVMRFSLKRLGSAEPSAHVVVRDKLGTVVDELDVASERTEYVLESRGANCYRFEVTIPSGVVSLTAPLSGLGLVANRRVCLYGGQDRRFDFRVPAAAKEVRVEVVRDEPLSARLVRPDGTTADEIKSGENGRVLSSSRSATAEDEVWHLEFPEIVEDMGFRIGAPAVPFAEIPVVRTIHEQKMKGA